MDLNLKLKCFFLASMSIGACTASLCKDGKVAINSEHSIWHKAPPHPSCHDLRGVPNKSEGFFQCRGDETSISLDLSHVGDKQGCYVYSTQNVFQWEFKPGTEFTFDAEWDGCEQVWMAPLWISPNGWTGPQGQSGELEILETCKGHEGTFQAAIMCNQQTPRNSQCFEPMWGDTKGGSGHFKGKIDANGTWTVHKCDLGDHNNCYLISRYQNFLSINNGSKQHQKFSLRSDLFNGGDGNEGWGGCGTLNHNTNCKYTIANIKVEQRTPDPSPSPTPDPSQYAGNCEWWCKQDQEGGTNPISAHCGGGFLRDKCGGCDYCPNCAWWCKVDQEGGTHSIRTHCHGDMTSDCGGCNYCYGPLSSTRSEL